MTNGDPLAVQARPGDWRSCQGPDGVVLPLHRTASQSPYRVVRNDAGLERSWSGRSW